MDVPLDAFVSFENQGGVTSRPQFTYKTTLLINRIMRLCLRYSTLS
jgi:hypothetical protein